MIVRGSLKEGLTLRLDEAVSVESLRTGKFVVVDGVKSRELSGVLDGALIFSPDSKRTAYVAGTLNNARVVVDGQPSPACDGIAKGHPLFSPDSRRVAYAAQRGKKWQIVIDDREFTPCDVIAQDSLAFSPDGRHAAWAEQRAQKWVVVVDGQDAKEYDSVLRGSKLLWDGPRSFHLLAEHDFELFLVKVQLAEE